MRSAIQQLDPGMAVLRGMVICFFIMEAVSGKIERERLAPRLQIIFSILSIF